MQLHELARAEIDECYKLAISKPGSKPGIVAEVLIESYLKALTEFATEHDKLGYVKEIVLENDKI